MTSQDPVSVIRGTVQLVMWFNDQLEHIRWIL